MKKTKIVATIGPASDSVKILQEMMKAGMNVCRLNFSHGEYSWHKKAIVKIRKAAKLEKKQVAIIADIQGPRIRIASKDKRMLKEGDLVFLTDQHSVHSHALRKELLLDWDKFYIHVKKGDRVFIEDGIIDLEITEKRKGGCVAKVLEGGMVKPRKGVNIPAISHHMGFLTPKDLQDLEFILDNEVEYIAVSFVGSKKDLIALKGIMKQWKARREVQNKAKRKKVKVRLPLIVSKIERKDAIVHLEDIIKESDAIMVARGDLAIEMPQEKVTLLQKDMITKCLKHKRPVIVATQMMASMMDLPRPTRAEIADVTNAVIDHTDAVMLSGESAQGRYPVKVIETMASIIKATEDSPYNDMVLKAINKVARLFFRAKKRNKKFITVKSFREAVNAAILRQENVMIKVKAKDPQEAVRASLVWAVE